MILLYLSCMPQLEGNHQIPTFPNPSITDFTVTCDTEEELWIYTLQTDAWTGNALLWLRDTDGREEEHPLISQGAPRDGSSDYLENELRIVGDWRDAQRGKSTRWPCAAQERLSMLVEVYHPKEGTATDCLLYGVAWPEETAPRECDQYWAD